MSKSIEAIETNFDLSKYLSKLLTKSLIDCNLRKHIQNDIESTKRQISRQLSSFDIDFNQFDNSFKQLKDLNNEIKDLEKQLNQFIESDLITRITELKDICNQSNERFNRSKQLSDFIERFKQIKNEMSLIDESFGLESYELSVQYMTSASELYDQLMDSIETNDDLKSVSNDLKSFLDSLKVELILKREELIYKTKKLFNSNVRVFRDEFNNENIFEFNLIKCFNSNEYQNFIKTFVGIEENNRILKELIKNLDLFFIKPILNEEINELVLEDNRIVAKFINSQTSTPLLTLKLFFDYFNQLVNNKNQLIVRQLMAILGTIWTEDIFKQMMKCYFDRLMPKNESEISSYLSLVDSAEDIRHILIQIGFIDSNRDSPFVEFALNINSYFCRRICTDFLISAKTIICGEIHKIKQMESHSETDKNVNSFPLCKVSLSMIELKELIQSIIDLSKHCSPECTEALIQTIENICELYIDVSPIYHNKMITDFPQQNALFHNNCMFFGHFIQSFASNNKKLDLILKYVPILRELGSQLFLKQMQSQEKLLLDLVQNPEFNHCLNDLATDDSKSGDGDQLSKQLRHVLKQCLVHLNFLRNALIDVLPEKVYYKSIGTVINSLFNELINKIQVQNDISSSGAVRLSNEIDFLFTELKTFLNTENPMRFVPKWSKLKEIHFILNATLLDIVNRWADGRGILSAEFTAQEVKQLIRALFQNTERRAQALNRITNSD